MANRLENGITLFAILLLSIGYLQARPGDRASIKSWRLVNGWSVVDSVGVDTSYMNLPMRDAINDYSISNSYNGNMVSPLESKLFFDRTDKTGFLFAKAFDPFIIAGEDVRFYKTNIAYSSIAYKKGFTTYREDNDLDFKFTGNVTRRTNLGLTLNYLNGVGHYDSQSGKRFAGSVFGSYNGDHYSCMGAVTFNTLSAFDNGGIQDVTQIGGILNPEDIPVKLNAMAGMKHIAGMWNHSYSICVERERKETIKPRRGSTEEPRDTIIIEYVPVTTFRHVLDINQSTHRYVEKTSRQNFYENTYFNTSSTADSANVLNIRNTLMVTFEEEFNKWLHFGADVYAKNECQRYGFHIADQTPLYKDTVIGSLSKYVSKGYLLPGDTLMGGKWVNNTWVGGSLYKNRGKYVHYGFNGDVCVVGYKIGEFQVNGHVDGDFKLGKDTLSMRAKVSFGNKVPDYFLQHYRSNHYQWNNSFDKTYELRVHGEVAYPMKYIQPRATVDFANITKYIYFDQSGMPKQNDGNIQVIAVNAQLNIRAPYFGMDNTIVWQMSSSDHISLPMLAMYNNIFYYGTWFRALDAQIGVDMRFFTSYYAPVLNPATLQFMEQKDVKVGNYPILNVYANFYVRLLHLKLFVQFTHFNKYFMPEMNYLSMPAYPYNPPVFRAGLAWHFYR
ncbi:MAG: putative porin [Paludibacteraceae bacterium]|nr:putative porin [Paludibacteraceae bacterium]